MQCTRLVLVTLKGAVVVRCWRICSLRLAAKAVADAPVATFMFAAEPSQGMVSNQLQVIC